jgi:nicotinate-nucleotide pyrophosphorylase (carboxylating)
MPHLSAALPDTLISLVVDALEEDHAAADATSMAVVPAEAWAEGKIIAKANGVLAGTGFADFAFSRAFGDSSEAIHWFASDGDAVQAGSEIMTICGPARALLGAERTALNFLQQLSGVATLTSKAVSEAGEIQVFDTRKTTPGLRDAQKLAVVAGGGVNHRRDLEDQLLLKENHFALSGLTYSETIAKAMTEAGSKPVGVEAETEEQARLALQAGATYVMLDDFLPVDLQNVAPKLRKEFPNAVLEVSGSLTPQRLAVLRDCGITRVSIGALTHSAPALDLSFQLSSCPQP